MDKNLKEWIETASYRDLLQRWRFSPIGDPIFTGELGEHYVKVMEMRRNETPDHGVSASKQIGW